MHFKNYERFYVYPIILNECEKFVIFLFEKPLKWGEIAMFLDQNIVEISIKTYK